MTIVESIDDLRNLLAHKLEGATITIDKPSRPNGTWWVDVAHAGNAASVEYRPGKGFGVSAAGGAYGEGPDVVVPNAAQAADQVVAFLVRDRLLDRWSNEEWRNEVVGSITRAIQRVVDDRFEQITTDFAKRLNTMIRELHRIEAEMSTVAASVRMPAAEKRASAGRQTKRGGKAKPRRKSAGRE